MREFATEEGKLAFSDEVLAGLAVWTALSTPGVRRVTGQGERLASIVNRDRLPKGVTVLFDEERAEVQLEIVVAYGVDIRVAARNVIAAVHRNAREQIGIELDDVDVTIAGVEPDEGPVL